jgi:hypothetical protein
MSGFEVRWPKPNLGYSWMVKNGLFPKKTACLVLSQWERPDGRHLPISHSPSIFLIMSLSTFGHRHQFPTGQLPPLGHLLILIPGQYHGI